MDEAGAGAPGYSNERSGQARLSDEMREQFLDHLAANCHLTDAARHIGVEPCVLYTLRRRDPAFAAAWGEALALGYEMLETRLVGHALAGEKGDRLEDGAGALPPINASLALQLLSTYRNAAAKPRRGGSAPKIATADETDRAIMAKLDAIEARRKAAAAVEGNA